MKTVSEPLNSRLVHTGARLGRVPRPNPGRDALGGLVLVAMLVGAIGRAHAADPRDPAGADDLFRQGRDAMKRMDYVTACPLFARSQALDPAPGTLLNLGTCEAQQGKLLLARRHLQEVVTQLAASDDRAAFARQQLAAVEKRIPRLTVMLAPDAPRGAVVTTDGAELTVGALGSPVGVDPGGHVVAVRVGDKELSRSHVVLAESLSKSLVVGPSGATEQAIPERAEPASAPSSSDTRAVGWTLVGLGGIGVATSLVTGAVALGKKSTVTDHCTPSETCDSQAGIDAASSGKTLSTVSTIAFVAGAAGVGAGIYLLLTDHDGATAAVTATAAPGFAGLRIGGGF